MPVSALIERFIESRWRCRPATLALYQAVLGPWATWMDEQRLEISPVAINRYLGEVVKRGVAQDTLANIFRVLRAFCRHFAEQGELERDPFSGPGRVLRPITRRRHMKTYTDEDVAQLLAATQATPQWKQQRSTNRWRGREGGPLEREQLQARALVLLLIDTGMRAGEAAALTCGDVRRREVIVHGKGGHEGLVFLSEPTRRAVLEVAGDRPGDESLFRGWWRDEPANPRILRGLLERLARRAGVDLPPRPLHAFRHYAARKWLANGLSTLTIQQLMRHSQVATTMLYCSLDAEELSRQHRRGSMIEHILELETNVREAANVAGPSVG